MKPFDRIRERLDRLLHPNKLKKYNLKFPPHMKPRQLVVLASNEKDALLMREYLIYEGFEV